MTILEARAVFGGYGGADILNGCDLTCARDEVVVIIGPNGAGKSTLMKAVFGLAKVREGEILFKGENIANRKPDQVVRKGISYVPQEKNVFPTMTIEENLEIGGYLRTDSLKPHIQRIYDLFPRLGERRMQLAGSLSGGERQMLAMGRALMLEPELLLLDEPTAGLSPLFIDQTLERVREINRMGVGILMVEQNAKQALAVADRGYVLVMGKDRYTGSGQELLDDPDVAELFLGG